MNTHDVIQDIVKHTSGPAGFTAIKVTSSDTETTLDAMNADRTVILKAKLHAPATEFQGEIGMGNLGFLAGVVQLDTYKQEGSTVSVEYADRKGVSTPEHLLFKDGSGNKDQYRFMSKEIIEQTLQTVKFKGVEWDITFEPTKEKVAELRQVAGIYGDIEPNFTVKTEDGNLIVTVGANDGSFSGKRIFATNVNGTLTQGYAWPLAPVLSILKLGMSSNCEMKISARGALQISVDSGIAQYDYILPALTV